MRRQMKASWWTFGSSWVSTCSVLIEGLVIPLAITELPGGGDRPLLPSEIRTFELEYWTVPAVEKFQEIGSRSREKRYSPKFEEWVATTENCGNREGATWKHRVCDTTRYQSVRCVRMRWLIPEILSFFFNESLPGQVVRMLSWNIKGIATALKKKVMYNNHLVTLMLQV